MWIQAGFDPDAFWQQTPRHFQIAMQAVGKRREGEAEASVATAWQTGAFSGMAQAGKLKPLKTYLRKEVKAQTPREMLAALKSLKAAGAPMTIRKLTE